MGPSRAGFRERFRGLPPSDATDYLADLYEAQGFAVDRGEGRLSVTRDGVTRTVALFGADDASDADVVVTRRGRPDVPAGATRLDPDDLYERTRYAVDAAASERLFETHFDGLPASAAPATHETPPEDPPDGEVGDTADRHGGRSAVATWSRRGLLVAAGGVVGGSLAVLGAPGPGDGTASTTPDRVETPAPTPSVPVAGLSTDGIADPAALAEAHAAATETRSYTLSLVEFRHDDALDLRSAIGLDLSLSADRAFLAVVRTAGPAAPKLLGEPPARSVYWSDGDVYYVDHRPDSWGGVSSFRPLRGWVGTWRYWAHVFAYGGTVASEPADFFRSLFAAVPTRLVGRDTGAGEPPFRLAGRAPSPETDLEHLAGSNHRDLDLTAEVDRTGLIRAHDLSYRARFEGESGRVTRSLAYTRVGETTVSRPLWAD